MTFPIITTKTGDTGTSGLYSGERMPKCDFRFKLVGLLDSFDSTLGLVRIDLRKFQTILSAEIYGDIEFVQERLQQFKGEIATHETSWGDFLKKNRAISPVDIDFLDKRIEVLRQALEDKNYKITGWTIYGSEGASAAWLDKARAECRMCEVELHEAEKNLGYEHGNSTFSIYKSHYRQELKTYINRLSDYLYLAARNMAV